MLSTQITKQLFYWLFACFNKQMITHVIIKIEYSVFLESKNTIL